VDAFCKRWKILKLEEFPASWGSFEADLHLLVTVTPDATDHRTRQPSCHRVKPQ
jgi:hypothetical protein